MNTKHINGPWRIGTPGPNGCYTVGTEHGLMVAVVAHSTNEPNQREAAIAHARLISAAPELLEALQNAIDLIEALDGKDNSCDPKTDIGDLKDVVAKATGASHVHDQ